ncbi:hypothetical protein AS180_19070 [Priestia veravalensis]|uniref:Uncharacterized protein n=1 Tax=Priestia veravalensis TaxID=1414648 RepID=A0A0V8JI57_9BACI|nr:MULTISPECIES: hypothetical protein [Priestia]KSU86352.1 hypothetical protein AS180_19070 [Priestia veravalensis]SCC53817.1 hypothetical protein GA0061087_10794 [Priestia flexa]
MQHYDLTGYGSTQTVFINEIEQFEQWLFENALKQSLVSGGNMTSLSLEAIPVPLFIVDKSGQIIDFTPSVTKMFLPASDIADIIDKDSHEKLKTLVREREEKRVEINMITFDNPVALFDVYYKPEAYNNQDVFICYPVHEYMTNMQSTLNQFRSMTTQEPEHAKQTLTVIEEDQDTILQLYSLSSKRQLREMKTNVKTVLDLLTIIYPDVIEAEKAEYFDLNPAALYKNRIRAYQTFL